MISAWRQAFNAPSAYFGFVQLSTWCALPPESLPQMREAQMAALALPNVGYATNADHGMGCSIHPSTKQYCGERLAKSALALRYQQPVAWRSPSYKAATPAPLQVEDAQQGTASTSLVVSLNDVSAEGLYATYPFNYASPNYGQGNPPIAVDCTASFPINATTNSSMEQQCAWAALHVDGAGWLNASVSIQPGGTALRLTSPLPAGSTQPAVIVGSAYGWGPIPMLNAYDRATGLPVLPWNKSL